MLDMMLSTLAQVAEQADDSACRETAGLESSSASAHCVSRSGRRRKRFVKVSVIVLDGSLVPASAVFGYGPGNDKTQAWELMDKASTSVRPDILYADAGYDAEWVHRYSHEDWGVMPAIKPVKHKEGPPSGEYQSQMTNRMLKKLTYGRRWLVETYNSELKRTTGSTLNAKTDRGRMIDAAMKVLAHAIRR